MIAWAQQNLGQIFLSVVSILFGVLASYVFYKLQKRDVVSAQQERIERAVEELIGILESYIVNKKELSNEIIINLIEASERAYGVNLKDACTPEVLLQDISLRLQKSKYLDIDQKSEYANQIVNLISQLKREETKGTSYYRS